MVEVNIKNMLKLPQLFKIIELVVSFIILLLYRIPDCIYFDPVKGEDAFHFADLVYIGYFFLCILQIFSILGGDKSPILDVLIAAFGFIFFLSIGSKVIAWSTSDIGKLMGKCATKGKALGSLSIIVSFLYLADTAFGGFAVIKS